MNKPRLIMLIGLPGSGKSTFRKKVVSEGYKPMIASSDDLIDMAAKLNRKTYDQVFAEAIDSANKAMYELVMVATQNDYDIIWDQTNLNRKARAKKLIMIPDHYRKIAVFFKTPDDLDARLANRQKTEGKSVPDKILLSMTAALEYPALDEGFDRIMTPEEFINEELPALQVA